MTDLIDAFGSRVDWLRAGRSHQELAELWARARANPRRAEMAAAMRSTAPPALAPLNRPLDDIAAELLGIDDATEEINPFAGGHASAAFLGQLRKRYRDTLRLDSGDVPGAVVPRPTLPAEPAVDDPFRNLLRVPATSAERARLHRWTGALGPALTDPLYVGCLPFMQRAEVTLVRITNAGATWYRFEPDASILSTRVPDALASLDASGVDIGVLPEATLDAGILKAWEGAIRDTSGDRLRLVLVGTGAIDADPNAADPPPNRAVVLDRISGERVLCQDKQAQFVMTASDLASWEPAAGFDSASGEVAHEWLTEGMEVAILEHAPLRLAVLVCEDLARPERVMNTISDWKVTHILVPVLSPPLQLGEDGGPFGWEANQARNYCRRVGSHVVVSNSIAHPGHDLPTVASFAYSARSPAGGYTRPRDPQRGTASGPVDAVSFSLPPSSDRAGPS